MDRIEIISPVHVGTGKKIEAPSYYREGDGTDTYRYNFLDILSQLPPNVFTDQRFLSQLKKGQKSKKELYRYLDRYVDYTKLSPMYRLYDDNTDDISDLSYDVNEQIKDLDAPYIPGSSIKGALINSWMYYLLKSNFNNSKLQVKDNMEKIVYKKVKNPTIVDFLYYDGRKHDAFIKDLQSCIVCRDIHFKQMEVLESHRIGSGKKRDGDQPLGYCECIQSGQASEEQFFFVDEAKKARIQATLDLYFSKDMDEQERKRIKTRYNNILGVFTKKMFLKSCTAFTQDILSVEKESSIVMLYNKYSNLNQFVNQLSSQIKLDKDNKKYVAYLRIGNSTNYFSKSISYLFKTKQPELFNEYFDRVFSPSTRGNTKANKFTLPKTRTIYSSYDKNYLPGFIKIEYD